MNQNETIVENSYQPITEEEIRERLLGKWIPKNTHDLLPDYVTDKFDGEILSLMNMFSVIHIKVLPDQRFEIIRTMGVPLDSTKEYYIIHPR